jgi:cell wall-associated NlpC family hydrolase
MLTEQEARRLLADRAIELLGTPYGHQGKGKIVDCLGFVYRVGVEAAMGPVIDDSPIWDDFKCYSAQVDIMKLEENLDKFLVRLPHRKVFGIGDILWLRVYGAPRHLGIVAGERLFVHACINKGKVVQYPIGNNFKNFIRAVWRFPKLQEIIDAEAKVA